jgi:putative MATE family efflux protein
MVIFSLFARPLLVLLDAPALEGATQYLFICAFGIVFIAGYNATSAAMRSVGNSRAPLICVAASCVLNIILDIIFVGPLSWGVAGAAIATVISQGVSFIVSLIIVLRDRDLYGLRLNKLFIRADKLKTLLRLGIPVCVQMTVANISWLSVMYLINGYGIFASAGNGVSVKIKNFCQLFITAMSTGSAAMIAQNIGAQQYDRARKVMYTAMRISIAVSLIIIALIELFAPQLVSIFTSDSETAVVAVKNLRIEIIAQVFYASFQMYHSLALGAGHTWFVLMSSFSNCILARLILAIIFNRIFGLTGIYYACMIAPAVSVPIGLWYERSNRWRKKLSSVSDAYMLSVD